MNCVFKLHGCASLGAALLETLGFPGFLGAERAARTLLRQACAAEPSAAHDDVAYEWTADEKVDAVNDALEGGVRSEMLELADLPDGMNNAGCPLPIEDEEE